MEPNFFPAKLVLIRGMNFLAEREIIISKKPFERIQDNLKELKENKIKACGNRYKYILVAQITGVNVMMLCNKR